MVSTGSTSSAASADPAPTATISPGNRGNSRRSATMATMVSAPIPKLCQLTVSRAAQSAGIFSMKSAGSCVTLSPKKFEIWPKPMITPMPMVNPLITGSGTKAIRLPARSQPATIRISPAMKVASTSPS
jgi:hypothetical protein